MMSQQIWEETLSKLRKELSEAAFKTWFFKTKLKIEGNSFEINCPNLFTKSKIETLYKERISDIITGITNSNPTISVTVSKEEVEGIEKDGLGPLFGNVERLEKSAETKPAPPPIQNQNKGISNLSPHYTFENFVIGSNNRLAFAMASAVAKAPGANANNPFFLYASVGLGKTHLVQAVGNEIIKIFPNLRVLYTTSENFTNELIDSIQHRTQNNFRKKFRNVDVLIVDDIQFIAGRESTQEEFFHTFNNLYLAQKQVVLTSDRHPKEITRLEERITSRFGGGIMADIQNPDMDTRLAILQTKLNKLNIKLPSEILEYIAASIETNIRELEGGLKQVVNVMLAQNGQVSIDDIKALFPGNHYLQQPKNVEPKKVIAVVCDYFGVRDTDLIGKRRTQNLVLPRQIAMYFLRHIYNLPLMKVGEIIGGKDHTTIMHGVSKINSNIEVNPRLKQDVINIQRQIETRAS